MGCSNQGAQKAREKKPSAQTHSERNEKSVIVGSFDLLKSAFSFRSRWRIVSWWNGRAENHHFRSFFDMITNSV